MTTSSDKSEPLGHQVDEEQIWERQEEERSTLQEAWEQEALSRVLHIQLAADFKAKWHNSEQGWIWAHSLPLSPESCYNILSTAQLKPEEAAFLISCTGLTV